MPEINVRRAGLADAATLSGLRWTWDVLENVPPEVERSEYDSRFAEWMRRNADTHLPFLAVIPARAKQRAALPSGGGNASDGDKAVGMAWLALLDRVPAASRLDRTGGDVQSVFILPHLRGQGVGRKLMAALTHEAARLGLMHVTVRSGRRPLGFYQRLGFTANERALEITPRS